MYIWVGIDVDSQLRQIREKAECIDRQMSFAHSCFTLPLHISLKISFEIAEAQFPAVEEALFVFYRSLHAFDLQVGQIENAGNIVWIRYRDNAYLSGIKDSLNAMLQEKFSVGMHAYDLDYIFHTTLFMDDDPAKVDAAYHRIKDSALPETLTADRFLIGRSPDGRLGTYSVYKEIRR